MRFKRLFLSLLVSLLLPISTIYAYSDKVILGGHNIGIEVKTNGVLVVGLYKVNNEYFAKDSGIEAGDYITKVNNNKVLSIADFTNEIDKDEDKESIDIEYRRNNKFYNTKLKLFKEDGEYKSGLFVKDKVNGIGTLTLIDPANNNFFALGHQIQDSASNSTLEIYEGSIYSSDVVGIVKSTDGYPGEKEASTDIEDKYGTITDNTNKGIFGKYSKEINDKNLISIGNPDEIVLGRASILTVLDGTDVKEYEINIDKIDTKDNLKNIMFSVTDKELLDKTGGIVQGMSGSPIIQNGKLIGAVTHVIVDDCKRGYGIFITNMLEEGE